MTRSQSKRSVNLSTFFATHAVFTVDDLTQYLAERGSTNQNTRKSLLTYYRSKGRIISIRRGLYATVPLGHDPETYAVDPYLVAAKLADDAVLAYHTALEYQGKAYSSYRRVTYTSQARAQTTEFQRHEYVQVPVPHALRDAQEAMFGVDSHHREGVEVRVTGFERTFVDVLDRPDLTGSWEEVWRSLESIEFLDLDQVVRYVELLGNSTTAAKVGFFLEQHSEALMIEEDTLNAFRNLIPSQPHYLIRTSRSGCKLVSEWNLLVPAEILNHSWDEVL
ncbi:MAG: hypothetical protein ACLFRR_09990 [Spirochaetaceae bacterium]